MEQLDETSTLALNTMLSLRNSSVVKISESSAQPSSEYCYRLQDENFFLTHFITTLISIILHMLSCPVIVVLNLLVIVVVKTRRRLQSSYNILLACLAVTDLLVGTVTQPALIGLEIFALAGGSIVTYCKLFGQMTVIAMFPVLPSLLHLMLISVERYIALKYALRYHAIVTKGRLLIAVAICWLLANLYTLLRTLTPDTTLFRLVPPILFLFVPLIIAFCHTSVYLVTRRHKRQILTEQFSQEAAAEFLKEKKAWKTTSFIIGFVFVSFTPAIPLPFWRLYGYHQQFRLVVLPFIYYTLTVSSLFNPIIYCWRCGNIRKAIAALIGIKKSRTKDS